MTARDAEYARRDLTEQENFLTLSPPFCYLWRSMLY
jgi:hypothetical protein